MKIFTKEEMIKYREAFNEYIDKYGSLYPEYVYEFITNHFMGPEFFGGLAIDVMSQIYEETGVYEAIGKNLYQSFLEYMQTYYDIDRNLLDVGCGFFPSFSKKVASSQKSGSVKAIDYDVITTDIPGITVEKVRFDTKYDISNIDMIYGLEPCEATTDMIKVANAKDIDLCICMCGCTHIKTDMGYEMNPYRIWLDYVIQVMKSTLPKTRKFEMEYTDFHRYPIFRTYKKTL